MSFLKDEKKNKEELINKQTHLISIECLNEKSAKNDKILMIVVMKKMWINFFSVDFFDGNEKS